MNKGYTYIISKNEIDLCDKCELKLSKEMFIQHELERDVQKTYKKIKSKWRKL